MHRLQIIWNPEEAHAIVMKHSVSFEDANSFFHEFTVAFYDDEHSSNEDRFLLLGLSVSARLLLACHCYRESDAVIRIISARKAARAESKHYRRPTT